jgi:RNA polymerase sigma-70 factor, ECF subfamily
VPVHEHLALRAEFEALYEEHFAFVWRALRSFGVPQASLEDATQDVFVVVYRRFGTWEQASLRAWLHGVARRVAASRRRTDQRHDRKLEALPRGENVHAIDERVDARQQLARLAAAIDRLAPERREVYVLAEIEGMRPPEIAAMLGCNLNTVYSRLRRARAQLSAALAKLEHFRAQPAASQAAAANDRGSHAQHGRHGRTR